MPEYYTYIKYSAVRDSSCSKPKITAKGKPNLQMMIAAILDIDAYPIDAVIRGTCYY